MQTCLPIILGEKSRFSFVFTPEKEVGRGGSEEGWRGEQGKWLSLYYGVGKEDSEFI